MPYVKPEERKRILEGGKPESAGELNYAITVLIREYLREKAHYANDPLHYEDYNEVIGVLESCKIELYRRVIARYEDEKIEENGDVW